MKLVFYSSADLFVLMLGVMIGWSHEKRRIYSDMDQLIFGDYVRGARSSECHILCQVAALDQLFDGRKINFERGR